MNNYGRYEDVYVREPSDLPPLGLISVWFGVILVTVTAVAYITDAPESSWVAPLLDSLHLLLIAFILGSLLYLPLRAHEGMRVAALPLIINVGTLVIIYLVPFAELWRDLRFQMYTGSYHQVVQMIETGELPPDAQGMVQLPDRYQHLSAREGIVLVEKTGAVTRVLFPTSLQSSGKISGYLYRSDNHPPQPGDFGMNWRHIVEKRPFWFYCSSE